MAIEVVARDWDRTDWCGGFYPQDLPEDWRLTYFANAFDSVLVPVTVWQRSRCERLARWAEDVPERFRFYLELGPPEDIAGQVSPAGGRTLQRNPAPALTLAAAALGDRFGGTVTNMPVPDDPARFGLGPGTEPARTLAAWDATGSAIPARQVPRAIMTDPKAAVAWLMALNAEPDAHPALAILDNAPAEALSLWRQLVLLAGLA